MSPVANIDVLFQPLKLGPFELSHRFVYPPLTRCRALETIPQQSAAEYYTQRSTPGGLVIAEGTIVEPRGYGYPCTPGIHTPEQIEAWKPITAAVKAKGAVFFCQIWHVGRSSIPDYQPNGDLPIAPSAIAPKGSQSFSLKSYSMVDCPVPRALETEEIAGVVQSFRTAARNAIDAGFDGVEIHGANGYLLDEFLKSNTNTRTDQYGGSLENRARFPLEVAKAVIEEIGADRVGFRLSPFGGFGDMHDADPYETNVYMATELNKLGVVYTHWIEPRIANSTFEVDEENKDSLKPFREAFKGVFISSGGHTAETGVATVASGAADLVAYGRKWIANPDLPKRFQLDAPLTPYDRTTFYTQGLEGYTDYPFLEDSKVEATA